MVEKKYTKVRYRFAATLITNILKVVLSFISGIIIARSLGPAQYGDFNFLFGSFTALIALFNMASSSAFYTIISKEKQQIHFYLYYLFWIIIQLFLLILLVFLLPESIRNKIWLGHSNKLIYLALFASFSMNKIWQFVGQIGESMRDTIGIQVRNLVLAVSYFLIVLFMGYNGIIGIEKLFIINATMYLFFSILYIMRINKNDIISEKMRVELSEVLQKFKNYCYPLVPYTVFGFVYTFIDYWMLQKFGGSVQQGYYAIGYKFSTLVLIGTTSILQVFWKEISEAYSKNNMERVRLLYISVSRSFFFVGIAISSFVVPYSREIIDLFLGPSYKEAWLPLALMLFYPVHQSLGQITGTMLLAMEKTKAQSYIGIFFMSISIIVTYVLLAPKTAIVPGFDYGATGLALKMVLCQLIGVNISIFFVSRYIKIPFDWKYQIWLICLMPSGFIIKKLSENFISILSFEVTLISSITVSLIFYLIFISTIIYFFPALAGIKKGLFKRLINSK